LKEKVYIYRDENGVPHIDAASIGDLLWGQGYVHGTDRALQMLTMRLVGEGRLCEILRDSDENLKVDLFFRRMGWYEHCHRHVEKLSNQFKSYLAHYCDGVNAALGKKRPWELEILGYTPRPWEAGDSILLSRMTGFLSLAQSQGQIERALVELVRLGVRRSFLEELFPGKLEGLDPALIRQVTMSEYMVPPIICEIGSALNMMASNNWVVHGSRTASGKPILANDPHLEVNRLPAVWCEMVLEIGQRFAMGGSMPGLPGILIGRSDHLAWGATYSMMDAVDSWIERCRDGCYEKDGAFHRFRERTELIRRKKHEPHRVVFYENDHGVLEGDPHEAGFYLATRWAASASGYCSVAGILSLLEAETAAEAMAHLGRIETSWNWLVADREGNIGYQMSGLMPKRRAGHSGLVPLPGWDSENDWQGFVPPESLPRAFNPESRVLVTANNDLNHLGEVDPINAPIADYRARRIAEQLQTERPLNMDDMFRLQCDVYSLQAEAIMAIASPLLPETEQGAILRAWDRRYTTDATGAYLFEQLYSGLITALLANVVGTEAARFWLAETSLVADFYGLFDRILTADASVWFGKESREAFYRRVAASALEVTPKAWGEHNRFVMKHLVFGGRLPTWFGFDHGPISVAGGRATVQQGQLYRDNGRETSFFPSLRIVTDLAQLHCYTNLPGGPSDRRFSRWYLSDLGRWLAGRYKIVTPEPRGARLQMK